MDDFAEQNARCQRCGDHRDRTPATQRYATHAPHALMRAKPRHRAFAPRSRYAIMLRGARETVARAFRPARAVQHRSLAKASASKGKKTQKPVAKKAAVDRRKDKIDVSPGKGPAYEWARSIVDAHKRTVLASAPDAAPAALSSEARVYSRAGVWSFSDPGIPTKTMR